MRQEPAKTSGVLYVVATPIGNLEDITLRALRILKEVSLIACEDTRQTQKLLNHFGITGRMVSYYQQNEAARAGQLLEELQKGSSVALVSDAGMPGISDPGFRLVSAAIEHGIAVVPVPGASALVAALAAGGLPTDAFRFGGFLPAKSGQRRHALETIRNSDCTEIFYEAPHRVKETLRDVAEVLGEARPVVIARELTKVHEEFLRGTAGEVMGAIEAREEIKGEITLLIGKAEKTTGETPRVAPQQRLREIMAEEKVDERTALKKLAREMGVSKSEAYRVVQRGK